MGYKIEPKFIPELSECLNLGSGVDLRKGFVNLDKADIEYIENIEFIQWDFEYDRNFGFLLPFPHSAFDYILARDVLEHVPHRVPGDRGEFFFQLVDDMLRISKHGAIWEIISPCRPDSMGAPGHTRLIDESTFAPWTAANGGCGSGEIKMVSPHRLICVAHENHRQWDIHDTGRFGRAIVKRLAFRVDKRTE